MSLTNKTSYIDAYITNNVVIVRLHNENIDLIHGRCNKTTDVTKNIYLAQKRIVLCLNVLLNVSSCGLVSITTRRREHMACLTLSLMALVMFEITFAFLSKHCNFKEH